MIITGSSADQQRQLPRQAATGPDARILMRVQGLRKAFNDQTVLRDIEFTLTEGEVVLLRGENASGKTTVLNMVTGNVKPDAGTIMLNSEKGQMEFRFPARFPGLCAYFTAQRFARMGFVKTWQDVRLFPNHELRDNIAIAVPNQLGEKCLAVLLRPTAVRRQERHNRARAGATLNTLGLADRQESSGSRISHGQSRRVAIARAIEAGAKVLFLDEPTAGLDSAGATVVVEFLHELSAHRGVTLVLVEHTLNVEPIRGLVSTVWTLEDGRIRAESKEIAFRRGDDRISSSLALLRGYCDEPATTEELPNGATLTKLRLGNETARPIMEVSDLVVSRGRRLVIGGTESDGPVQGFSLTLRQGELAVLRAPNGWGKTTLIEAITGLLPIDRGTVSIDGRAVQSWPAWMRRHLGLSTLSLTRFSFSSLRVEEALQLARIAPPDSVRHLLKKHVSDLSGGEKQNVAIACAMHPSARIVLLDEPFANLDDRSSGRLVETIRSRPNDSFLICVPDRAQLEEFNR